MADEEDKVAAPQPAPTTKDMPRHKAQLTDEERRIQDALEDDDVLESLKELHADKAKGRLTKTGPTDGR
jgi:hypothetical protein